MEKLKLELTQQQVQVITAALAELPYRIAQPVFSYINAEVDRQLQEHGKAISQENSVKSEI